MFCSHCGHKISEGTEVCSACGKDLVTAETSSFVTASWQKRFLNLVIDTIALFILGGIMGVLFGDFPNYVSLLVTIVFYIVFEALTQKTPGKFLTKTKVVSRSGLKAPFWNIVGRSCARYIPFDALSFIYVHPIGWHDRASGTLVVADSYTAEDVKKINMKPDKRSAWWMVLIIVGGIFVLGLVAVIGIVALGKAREISRDVERIDNMGSLRTALNLYYQDTGTYPTELKGGLPLSYGDKVYLAPVPNNPMSTADSNCPNLEQYDYTVAADGKNYSIEFCLEAGTDEYEAGTYRATAEEIIR